MFEGRYTQFSTGKLYISSTTSKVSYVYRLFSVYNHKKHVNFTYAFTRDLNTKPSTLGILFSTKTTEENEEVENSMEQYGFDNR